MPTPAYNKVTRQWVSTNTGLELMPPEDWVINPIFEDRALAEEVGPVHWTFDGNVVKTPTQVEWDAMKLSMAKLAKWREIQAKREALRRNGTKVGTKWFHSDDPSRIQQIGLVMFGAGMPAGIMWKTQDGSFILMTPTLAQQIFGATAQSDSILFTIAEQKKAQMYALTTLDAVVAFDFSTGWPATFEGVIQ